MKRILALVAGILVTLSLVPAGGADAKGGWAVSTLDPLPTLEPGETADIGFTVRQHGVTPVDVSESGNVGIAFRIGKTEFFAAEPQGAVGHYVARVVVPKAGTYQWEVRQGFFAPHPLGTIELSTAEPAAAPPAADASGDGTWLDVVRWLSIGLALGLGLLVAVDVLRSRRGESAVQTSA
ncbi:MAG: hypothetical protein M3337_08645 [Actinomycetota bacterium]|nr:hypothetical protein [Actinomycetota bacterium]